MESFHNGEDLFCTTSVHMTFISTYAICKTIVMGQFVTLSKTALSDQSQNGQTFLHICELEIYGTSKCFNYSSCIYFEYFIF